MLGDNIQSLRKLPDNSIDSIVTDPPYGLSFMNKKWDYDVPSVEFWKEVYRVLKPGGHILSFGGTRTYHRMVVNIEDAGFEIRDQIMWLYGSGFPKSHNIGKAVDKLQGNDRQVVGDNPNHRTTAGLLELGFQDGKASSTITKGTSPYEGWGTALKPANEPICVARKPLSEKSVAENVLKWGTGGINVDGCRVGFDMSDTNPATNPLYRHQNSDKYKQVTDHGQKEGVNVSFTNSLNPPSEEGRFPANIILDEIAGEMLDLQSGIKSSRFFYQAKVSKAERNMGLDGFEETTTGGKGHGLDRRCSHCNTSMLKPEDCKCEEPNWITPPKKNSHPTVKPVSLMAYLCRLVTPPNGIVLDPFMGSGSTGIAAQLEGFRFCGMEMDKDYFKIAEARIENYEAYRKFIK
jgi:site-specific DNA-methyltransferase (adenine-specific)